MNKLYKTTRAVLAFALGVVMISSCTQDAIVDKAEDNLINQKGAIATISNVVGGFFDLTDKENAAVSFDLGEAGEAVSSIDIFKSYNGGEPVMHANVTPGALTVSLQDAISGLGIGLDDVAVGDVFELSFKTNTASGTYNSGATLPITASCPSALGGTYSYVSTDLVAANSTTACPDGEVTGEVTFEDQGGGKYLVSDLGFGQYSSSCWNDQPATSGDAIITDVCNVITSGGLDQYGLAYTWTITDVSGPNLSISWVNNYDDSGKTVLTRMDGTDWPALTTN